MSLIALAKALIDPWQPYDPSWLIELALEQLPEETWLPEAFAKCIRAKGKDSPHVRFVSSRRPNQPGSVWQFEKNLMLVHPQKGEVVVDVLTGRRIGAIEFWEQLLQR